MVCNIFVGLMVAKLLQLLNYKSLVKENSGALGKAWILHKQIWSCQESPTQVWASKGTKSYGWTWNKQPFERQNKEGKNLKAEKE